MKQDVDVAVARAGGRGCHSSKPIEQAPQAVQTQRMQSDRGRERRRLALLGRGEPDAQVPPVLQDPRIRHRRAADARRGRPDARHRGRRPCQPGHGARPHPERRIRGQGATGVLAGRGRRGGRAEGEARLRSRHASVSPARASPSPTSTPRGRNTTRRRASCRPRARDERGRNRPARHVRRRAVRRRHREEVGRAGVVRGPGDARVRRGQDRRREDRDRRAGHDGARHQARASRSTSPSTHSPIARSRRGSAASLRRPTPRHGTSRSRSRSPTVTTC